MKEEIPKEGYLVIYEGLAEIFGFSKEEVEAAKKHPHGKLRDGYYLNRHVQ